MSAEPENRESRESRESREPQKPGETGERVCALCGGGTGPLRETALLSARGEHRFTVCGGCVDECRARERNTGRPELARALARLMERPGRNPPSRPPDAPPVHDRDGRMAGPLPGWVAAGPGGPLIHAPFPGERSSRREQPARPANRTG